jgi:LPS-assembly lipoprotein
MSASTFQTLPPQGESGEPRVARFADGGSLLRIEPPSAASSLREVRAAFPLRGKGLIAALVLAAAASLGGCGFTPLYADPGAVGGLTHIQVVAPQGRVGYLLREDLDDALGRAKGEAPKYRLEMVLNQVRQAHGLTANDTAQRYELDLTVIYTLIDISSGKVATTGQVSSDVSYDSTVQPYAGIAARQDTQNRLASDAAQKIQVQIAAWLATHAAG